MRVAKTALGVAILGSLLFSGASAFGATAPTSDTIKVFVTPKGTGSGTVVITGAIGDYGKTVKSNAAGKPAKDGGYEQLVLTKGAILVNATQLNAVLNSANPTDFSVASCSGTVVASAPVPIVSGTKAYAGITGSVTLTATFAFVGPFYSSGSKKGECNTSSSGPNPPGAFATIAGSGTVSFG